MVDFDKCFSFVLSCQGSESPVAHALYVWDNFIEHSAVKHVAVVAHSYGGVVTSELVSKHNLALIRLSPYAFETW